MVKFFEWHEDYLTTKKTKYTKRESQKSPSKVWEITDKALVVNIAAGKIEPACMAA